MKKIYKIANIALIFTIIAVFLGQSLAYASDIAHLRVPVGNYERLEKSLAGQAGKDPASFPNPIRKIRADSIKFLGINRGNVTVTKEAEYIDEKGVTRECFAKYAQYRSDEGRVIMPQARILRFLNSKNMQGIPRILDFVETRFRRKIILFEKFPPGMTLDKKTGIISIEEAVDVMLQVTRILKSLLDRGVYHWDVKLENIWITNKGEVILFDFDFVFMEKDEFIDRKLYLCGSSAYMSEKRKRLERRLIPLPGESLFSHTDEIFSLGKSLSFLLELDKDQITPDLQGLINKALAEDGAGEYKTIDEFLGDLEKVKASMTAAGNLAERLNRNSTLSFL